MWLLNNFSVLPYNKSFVSLNPCLLYLQLCFVHWISFPLSFLSLINVFNSRENVIACAKHFVGDGGTKKGTNEGDTILSYDELERVHMAPYLDCISQGVCTIMASYSSWNGTKLHTSHFLLTQILKEKLGFKVSRWQVLQGTSQTHTIFALRGY